MDRETRGGVGRFTSVGVEYVDGAAEGGGKEDADDALAGECAKEDTDDTFVGEVPNGKSMMRLRVSVTESTNYTKLNK
jgi:hypothetical protein